MEVILLEKIGSLGSIGSIVSVKNGFARNFLLPRKKALRATKENLAYFETQRQRLEEENQKKIEAAQASSRTMEGLVLDLIRQAGESGHLFGSVRSQDIAEAAAAKGYSIQKSQVMIQSPIKTLGVHEIKIALHPEVVIAVKVNIAQTDEEAQAQWDAYLNGNSEVKTDSSKESIAVEAVEEDAAL